MCYTKYGMKKFFDEKIFIFGGKIWKFLLTNVNRRPIIEVQTIKEARLCGLRVSTPYTRTTREG